MISSCNVSVVLPPSSRSPSTGPLCTPIYLRLCDPPLPLGIQISPPHQPHPLHSSCDSSDPLPSGPWPDVCSSSSSSPSPLALQCLRVLLLLLRLFLLIAGTSLWVWWKGEYSDLPQDRDNIVLHHPLPHHCLSPDIHENPRHHRLVSGSWLPSLKGPPFWEGRPTLCS